MQVSKALTKRLSWLVAAQLLVAGYAPLAGVPGTAIPLAVAVVLIAALGVIAVAALDQRADPAAQLVFGAARFGTRRPARQCDPDAAGHVRPRAPGR